MDDLSAASPSELAKIPLSVLVTLPALQPPAGVEANFTNPEDRSYILVTIASVLFCLMASLFANRIYTKSYIIRKASWDDCEYASEILNTRI